MHINKKSLTKIEVDIKLLLLQKNQWNVPSCFFGFSSYTPSSMGQKPLGQNAQCNEIHIKKTKTNKDLFEAKMGNKLFTMF